MDINDPHCLEVRCISDDQNHQESVRAICACGCSSLCKEGADSIGREFLSYLLKKLKSHLKFFRL